MNSLSFITPAYNEEEIIVDSVVKTLEAALTTFDDIEYIIVNDGSTDKTKDLVEEAFASHPLIKITHKTNGGFGSAINTGLSLCSKDYVICVPADSPLDKKTMEKIYSVIHLDNPDLIITYRNKRKGYSFLMLTNSYIYHKLVSILFLIWYKDYNWIHVYRRAIFEQISIDSKGIFMLAEIIVKSRNKGFSIKEIEVEQLQRVSGEATMTKPAAIFLTLKEMIKFRLLG